MLGYFIAFMIGSSMNSDTNYTKEEKGLTEQQQIIFLIGLLIFGLILRGLQIGLS